MAAAATMKNTVNSAITNSPAAVREAIAGRATVLAALEASGLLAGLPPNQVGEVHWVLAQLTVEHNQTVLATIDTALAGGQTAVVEWIATAVTGVDVEDVPGGKKVTVRTPMPPN
jgi:hypothetical protein